MSSVNPFSTSAADRPTAARLPRGRIDIDGVEISPDMLAILGARAEAAGIDIAGRVHQSAMESMALPRRYRVLFRPVVIVPAADRSGRRGERDAAIPRPPRAGGTLVMPWIDITRDYPDGAPDEATQEVTLEDGSVIRLTYHGWFEPATGLEHTDELYERLIDGKVVERERVVRSPATRHYDRAMIQNLHTEAGLSEPRWFSGFTRETARPDDRIVTTLARRPG